LEFRISLYFSKLLQLKLGNRTWQKWTEIIVCFLVMYHMIHCMEFE